MMAPGGKKLKRGREIILYIKHFIHAFIYLKIDEFMINCQIFFLLSTVMCLYSELNVETFSVKSQIVNIVGFACILSQFLTCFCSCDTKLAL